MPSMTKVEEKGKADMREVSNRTGRRPSGKERRHLFFSYQKGRSTKDTNCDCWHPPFCVSTQKKDSADQVRIGPFVQVGKDDCPPSPTRRQQIRNASNLIANGRAGGETPCRLPNMKKSIQRDTLSATGQLNAKSHSTAQLTTSRSFTFKSRNPNSRVLKDLSADWTEYQEDQVRHKAWKLHEGAVQQEGVFTDVDKTKVLKGYSSMEAANTSKPKPILQSKNRMYIVDGGASLHVMGESVPLPQERKPYGRPKTWRSKPRMTSTVPQKDAIICIQELGTCCT